MAIVVGTDTYISVANADTYFTNAIHATAWAAAITATKEKALVTATRMLDRQDWVGAKTSGVQALDWPRTGVTDSEGTAISSVSIPSFIEQACCELALALLNDPSVQTNPDQKQRISSMSAGSASISFFSSIPGARFPTIVHELIGWYLSTKTELTSPFISGADVETKLKSYELSEGL